MSIAEKPSCYSFRIYALPDRVFRTEIGRISSQSKGQIAGGRQGVEKHLFADRPYRNATLSRMPTKLSVVGYFHSRSDRCLGVRVSRPLGKRPREPRSRED